MRGATNSAENMVRPGLNNISKNLVYMITTQSSRSRTSQSHTHIAVHYTPQYSPTPSYNNKAANPRPPSTTIGAVLPAAPVNSGDIADPVGLPIMPPPLIMLILGFVAFPAAHDGTGTPERVTITSAGGPVGHAGLMVIVDVVMAS
jgi:hypothetical protein